MPGFFEGTEMPDAGWWEALWPDPARVLAESRLAAGMAAVDLCAGNGWFTLHMARIARRVAAIDIDGKLLESARLRLDEAGVTNCQFLVADAYDLAALVTEPVEFVFMANAFHGVPDQARLCKVVAGILSPGGLFAIVNWHRRPRQETTVLGAARGPKTELRMSPQDVQAIVEPSGFTLTRVAEVGPYHYSAIFKTARAPAD